MPEDDKHSAKDREVVWLIFRDIEGYPRKQFEYIGSPRTDHMVSNIGKFRRSGYNDYYVMRYHTKFDQTDLTVISYTEKELTREQSSSLLSDACDFAMQYKDTQPGIPNFMILVLIMIAIGLIGTIIKSLFM